MTKFRCSMQKKIESLCRRGSRAEGIDDVVNYNAVAARDPYNGNKGRYGKAQDILNYNKNNDHSWKFKKFIVPYIVGKYGVEWSDGTGKEQYKFWFKDKKKAQEFVDVLCEYADISPDQIKLGRSVGEVEPFCGRVLYLINQAFKKCPEWQKDFNDYISDDIREPVDNLKKSVDRERSVSPKQHKFDDDLGVFIDELEDVIRNAVKMSAKVEFRPRMYNGDAFSVMIDHDSTSKTSTSISNIVNKLVQKHSAVVGDDYIDMGKAAKVLADLEKSLG